MQLSISEKILVKRNLDHVFDACDYHRDNMRERPVATVNTLVFSEPAQEQCEAPSYRKSLVSLYSLTVFAHL